MATVTAADADALAAAAADLVGQRILQSVAAHGNALVALTGGHTPEPLYERLADPAHAVGRLIDWARVHVLWGDERYVPPSHPDSNFGMARRALLSRVPIPPSQVHRIPTELPDARAAAREYERVMRSACAEAGRADTRLDVVLLGIGADAHIASLFPGSPLLEGLAEGAGRRTAPLVAGVWVGQIEAWRVTMTPAALLDASAVLVIAAGAGKADAVYQALAGPLDVARWPAQILREADDRVTWILDEGAAAKVSAPRSGAAARPPGARRA